MKITDSEVIKSGERELIDTITGDLDWNTIEKVVRDHHKLNIQDDVEYKQGDIIVHDNKVAYRLDFEVKMTLSVVFDRDGTCLSLTTANEEVIDQPEEYLTADADKEFAEAPSPAEPPVLEGDAADVEANMTSSATPVDQVAQEEVPSDALDDTPGITPDEAPQENLSRMASHIADMISEINEE